MSKKILGLLLALCLVIGLLPMATFAEANPAKINFSYAIDYPNLGKHEVAAGSTTYLKMNADKKPVLGSATDWCVKFEYPTEGAATLTLKDVDMSGQIGFIIGHYFSSYKDTNVVTCEVPINVVLEGTNKMKVTHGNLGAFDFYTKGAVTFSGTGSLEINANRRYSSGGAGNIHAAGSLTFDGVNVDLVSPDDYSYADGIVAENGNVTIKNGAKVTVTSIEDKVATDFGGSTDNNETLKYGVNVKAGDLVVENSALEINAYIYGTMLNVSGKVQFKNSDIVLANQKATSLFSANNLELTYANGFKAVTNTQGCSWDKDALVLKAGNTKDHTEADFATNITDVTTLKYLKITHNCAAAADDKDCTTPTNCATCGKEMAAAQTAHNLPADDGDCTTAVKCQNAGCEYVSVEAKAAHVAGADDGDCTTAVKCTNPNCTKDAVEAKQHTPGTRTDCSVAANCTVCGKEAIPAGQHGGGTATCKDKAKCATCGQEYGELGACAPAVDDGDCTTAIKCTVCGKETTPAKTAHAYTDNKDASCNNEGCTKTRVIEADKPGTNGSPATGDVSILLSAAVALASAASVAGITLIRKKEN